MLSRAPSPTGALAIMNFRPLDFVKETFTDLSGFKRRFLQVAAVLLVLGGGLQLWALIQGNASGGWSGTALTGGLGAILGFLVGAFVRLAAKVGLLLAGAAAAGAWGLHQLGIVDMPWNSYGEIYDSFAGAVHHQTTNMHAFLDGFLPSSGMTTMGLGAGLTQKPGGDDEDDD